LSGVLSMVDRGARKEKLPIQDLSAEYCVKLTCPSLTRDALHGSFDGAPCPVTTPSRVLREVELVFKITITIVVIRLIHIAITTLFLSSLRYLLITLKRSYNK